MATKAKKVPAKKKRTPVKKAAKKKGRGGKK